MNSENPHRVQIAVERKNARPDLQAIFSRNVRKIRKQLDLNEEALALDVGADQAYVILVEGGACNLTIEIVERFASMLNVSPAQLFGAVEDE